MEPQEEFKQHMELLLQTIFELYNYDFRNYSPSSMERRLKMVQNKFHLPSLTAIREKLQTDKLFFGQLLQYLTISTTEMFRDPSYFLSIRHHVVPILKTYPSIKIWIAGCSTGEEIYSFCILLKEEGLLERSLIYATDINPVSLAAAEKGVFPIDKIQDYSRNYLNAGGRGSLSDYYTTDQNSILIDKALRKNVVFADHCLATDNVFSEVQLVSCRNVMIYFEKDLQTRALGLFYESLCHRGFLGLGGKESLRFSDYYSFFEEYVREAVIYRRK